ncbi:hypothetical protein [Lentzea sp. E54]|uniref:hypothetical protein n=1 Tax=Lentzea xerophila TaxID=3435883 RepID=UPI003DA5CE2F
MNGFDYEQWLTSMDDLAARFVARFVARFGYPPGENGVRRAAGPLPDGVEDLPAPLVEFYRHASEVSLPDLQQGYFVSPARAVVNGRDGRLPVVIDGPDRIDIVSFGSDGGGTHFALGLPDGAPVYSLLPSGIDSTGVYDNHDSLARMIAATLPEFLADLQDLLSSEN